MPRAESLDAVVALEACAPLQEGSWYVTQQELDLAERTGPLSEPQPDVEL